MGAAEARDLVEGCTKSNCRHRPDSWRCHHTLAGDIALRRSSELLVCGADLLAQRVDRHELAFDERW
jgi:hypothetical protein